MTDDTEKPKGPVVSKAKPGVVYVRVRPKKPRKGRKREIRAQRAALEKKGAGSRGAPAGVIPAGTGLEPKKPAKKAPPPARFERTEFKPEYVDQVKKIVSLGATNADIADFFKVSISLIAAWCSYYPDFFAAIVGGRDAFTARVEHSLAHRAIGYTFDSEKIFMTKTGKIVRAPCREHVPPDVTACIFWLKNRDPERWKDVHHQRHSGNVAVTISQDEAKW